MKAAHANEHRRTFGGLLAAAALAVSCERGCDFDASGTGNPPAPQLCQLDLDPGPPMIDDPPYGLVDEEGLFEYEPFRIHWYVSYHAASDDWDGNTGEFTCQIEILKDDELVWLHEYEAEPLGKHHGRYEEFILEEGLPPGTYVARLTVDVDGTVQECSGASTLENNTTTVEFVVQGYPIDDFGTLPSGDDGADDSFADSDKMPDADGVGATLTNDGQFCWDPSGSADDDETRETDPTDPDPVDPNPRDPTPGGPGDLTAG